MHAWPLLYATALVTARRGGIGLASRCFAAIFIVEFAPGRMRRVLEPVVRLLAAVPSVIYGLIGILVLVPFVGNHVISAGRKESVAYVVQLDGTACSSRS
jgi:ABC-type phosphate transport system permease subunit